MVIEFLSIRKHNAIQSGVKNMQKLKVVDLQLGKYLDNY